MINEFFKSIFRTLGRIAAYILLGVLAYIILSWFGLPNVNADTINSNTYRVESITQSFGIGTSANYSSGLYIPNPTSDYGFQWLPVNGTSSSSWNYIPITSSSYSIDVSFSVGTSSSNLYNLIKLPGQEPRFTMYVGRNTQATCDGTETYSMIADGGLINGSYYLTYRYQCSQLDVNSNYSSIMFRILYTSLQGSTQTYLNNFVIQYSSVIDSNDLTSDANAIISANNQNTERIINAMANLWNNVDEAKAAIEAMDAQLHSDMQRMISDAEAANEEMLATITDDDVPDITFVEDIADWMPIDTPVTDIITLPINILNKTISSFGGTCQSYTINTGSLLGNHTWTFPCLNIGQYLTNYSYQGYNLWQLIDLMICMYMGYEILMLIISAYNSIANLDDTFDSLYQPKHVGYSMKHGEGRL